MDKTRCLLINSKLQRSFQAEVVSTACYIVNKSPSIVIGFKTPEEIWSSKPSSYKHLRIFGCFAYVHVRQGKLDARAVKGVFVGYPEGVKEYKGQCREAHMCLISRDVQFNEAVMINESNQAPSKIDTSAIKAQATEVTDKNAKFEVELSNDYKNDVKTELVGDDAQNIRADLQQIAKETAPQATDLQ